MERWVSCSRMRKQVSRWGSRVAGVEGLVVIRLGLDNLDKM